MNSESIKKLGEENLAAPGLALLAVILIAVAFFSGRDDLPTATLIVTACVCFLAAAFLMTFTSGRGIEPELAGTFSSAQSIALSRLAADMGCGQHACIYVSPETGEPMQFNPTGAFAIPPSPDRQTFCLEGENTGMISIPAGLHLFKMLEDRHTIQIPEQIEDIGLLLSEIFQEILGCADQVTTRQEGDGLVIIMDGYSMCKACRVVQAESPACCTIAPCAICSLIGCLFAVGTGKAWRFDHVVPEERDRIRVVLSPV